MTCDKCGGEVPLSNNAVALEVCLGASPLLFIGAFPRHLLPVVEGGKVVCAGSPSRAQYLEGQPRDSRPGFVYDESLEGRHREAYAELLKQAATSQ